VRYFLNSKNLIDVLDLVEGRRQAAMDSKDFLVDDGSNGQVVKNISVKLPHFGVSILGLTLSVEAINLSDLSRLMVSSDQADPLGVPEL
jgi:hypothetical protein